ncbi:poly-beta-1,6-N-acetyl-D-glucosamine synthase [Glaciimonas immobilis]|uniref:Poly-beta-1,6-N-acetyl-D-glucosamine synthase n=1 Tax=Glaciimonas immobilis TaxID=728004 RepID=A0A840RT68_9BURK|nr:poly-beta-1,6-N-acetyl-D-glucosamine synthase [Glaciimonas immobilis]KAF3996130.1 poly-beta-1,6 N-acetyl-D-glucosamine synthase [Glaciimonas immobilis]MBB5201717.1 biofilm PGA synthesis N-glycosyltransferase PgaC [Glaciimonas immobilis]
MENYLLHSTIFEFVSNFVFFYPLAMTHIWLVGALLYYYKWERNTPEMIKLSTYPAISILLPCHNEGDNIRETVGWLLKQEYPSFDILAINDGSKDNTGPLLDELARHHPKLRVVHLAENQGKAMGLSMGALLSANEYLICIDGDAILDVHACTWMMSHFQYAHVGAVTGNPRIRNRSTLLGRIQVGEFSSIVGIIKRAQRVYGKIFSVSGVVVAFRKTALAEVDYWTTDMVTEDVDITWKLQRAGWEVRFEPNAKCWILMPETIKGLWKQRLRWAQGGAEVFLRNLNIFGHWKQRHMWLVFIELGMSLIWVYTTVALILASLLFMLINPGISLRPWPLILSSQNTFFILIVTSLAQFAFGFYLDSRYEKQLWKIYPWIIWYPFLYWIMISCATFVGFPKALLKRKGERATWVSPDRGFKP